MKEDNIAKATQKAYKNFEDQTWREKYFGEVTLREGVEAQLKLKVDAEHSVNQRFAQIYEQSNKLEVKYTKLQKEAYLLKRENDILKLRDITKRRILLLLITRLFTDTGVVLSRIGQLFASMKKKLTRGN